MDMQKKYWKQFAAWVTSLGRNRFFLARIKLTAFYSLILAIMMTALSITVYRSALINITLDLHNEFLNPVVAQATLIKFNQDLEADIVIIDIVFVALMTTLSYVFAGEALRPLREAMEEQKRLTADVAHELRTPLSVMRADLELAQNYGNMDKGEISRLIKSNLEEVEQLSGLAGSLLVLMKEDAGASNFKREDFYALTDKEAKGLKVLAEKNGVDMRMEEGSPVRVRGNKESLGIMVRNVIKNAIQYTPSGGGAEISVREEGDKAVLRVKDTGVGISEKDLPRIMDRFYKADKSRTQVEEGAGLGLSIVNGIVRNHGGKIKINSVLEKGTEVVISLPIAD